MKQLFFIALLLTSTLVISQDNTKFGIKGGLNYNANGDYFESISETYQNPDRNVGFHLGVFGKFGDSFYFRPELAYTGTKSEYEDEAFSMKKLDAPLLIGVKVLGPLSVFGGPSFQYILDSKFGDISIDSVESDFSVGLNFGIAANFEKFGLDLRYERGFSENEASFLDNNGIDINDRVDTRPSQLIVSLFVFL
ncbi:MAG: PorT family protein [Flavobacteriaceae bacterium]|nr:PorT family protein [Flavobacteriaceae bacterium]